MIGEAAFSTDLAVWLSKWESLQPFANEIATTAVVAVITYLSVVVGELVPSRTVTKETAVRIGYRRRLLRLRAGAASLTGPQDASNRLRVDSDAMVHQAKARFVFACIAAAMQAQDAAPAHSSDLVAPVRLTTGDGAIDLGKLSKYAPEAKDLDAEWAAVKKKKEAFYADAKTEGTLSSFVWLYRCTPKK
jgi:hypothetical protein